MSTGLYVLTPAKAVEKAVIMFLYMTIVEGKDHDQALGKALARCDAIPAGDLRGYGDVGIRGACPSLLAQAKAYRKSGRKHIVSEKCRRRRERPVEE